LRAANPVVCPGRLAAPRYFRPMSPQAATRHSKFLSLHLRHQPEKLGLTLEPGGWVPVAALLAACAAHGHPLSLSELQELVTGSDKQRFAFDETGRRIRAQQGHSVAVDLQLAPAVPPPVLYHGTVAAALPAIRREGLQKMNRHHVHLSPDEETARRVGNRRGPAVLLRIKAAELHQAGTQFYQSGNGVWLVEAVPLAFIEGLGQ